MTLLALPSSTRSWVRAVLIAAALVAHGAFAMDPRPLHPVIRDRLGPVRVVVAFPQEPWVYDPLRQGGGAAAGAAAGQSVANAPPGAGGAAAAGAIIGLVLVGFIESNAAATLREESAPMRSLFARTLEQRAVPELARARVAESLSLVEWLSATEVELSAAKSNQELLGEPNAGGGAVLVLRFTPLLSTDGRQVNIFVEGDLYHPQLGPEFTKWRRGGKRTPMDWKEASLVATPSFRWSTPGWTVLQRKTEADRDEEIAAINAWFKEASAGVGKVTREKLDVERRKRLHAASNNNLSVETSRARTVASWEADGGEALSAQLNAALDALLPKLMAALGKVSAVDEDAAISVPH